MVMEFDMKDLGLMHYYFGLEVWHGYLVQGKYVINSEYVWHEGSQTYDNPYGQKLEDTKKFWIKPCGSNEV